VLFIHSIRLDVLIHTGQALILIAQQRFCRGGSDRSTENISPFVERRLLVLGI
jgi:hypothetical protein